MKKIKIFTLFLLAVVMLFTSTDILGAPTPKVYRVVLAGNTYVRWSANGSSVGHIRQGATFTLSHVDGVEIVGNWSWLRGGISGTATQTNGWGGNVMWVSTSQLTRVSDGIVTSCSVIADGTVVRHTPGGINQGMIGRGATFRPSGISTRSSGGWTWHLGTIGGTSAGHNGWGGSTDVGSHFSVIRCQYLSKRSIENSYC